MNLELNQFLEYKNSNRHNQYSQLGQDLLVGFLLNNKRDGYFVDFGATNGIEKSNTYLLEKQYGWNGILCEPAKPYHQELLHNRKCNIDFRCVYNTSHDYVPFRDCNARELSCIDYYHNNDSWSWNRVDADIYSVETITLNDLLSIYNAPRHIDYISIDTEGSEYDILSVFDFNQYNISILTVEHNYTDNYHKIKELLHDYNFECIYSEISDFDSWFINKNVYN